jgi:membrane peptidoglycan carboxypeptidase
VRGGRTTDIASIISLLGAFLVAAAVLGVLVAGLAMPAVGGIGAVTRTAVDMFDALPSALTASPLSQQSRILDSRGNVIATPSVQNRIIVPLSAVAPVMQRAQLAIEDSRFYEHGGVDVHGLVRALVSNAAGTSVQGGSTLTQQYVKLILQNTALQAGDTQAAQAAAARSGLAGLTRKLRS